MTGVSALRKYHFSPHVTKKIFSVLVLATVNAALIFGRVDDYLYIMQGLYGSLFGIIAGPIGIRLSYVNQIHQMKRSWSAFVILVCKRMLLFFFLETILVHFHNDWCHHRISDWLDVVCCICLYVIRSFIWDKRILYPLLHSIVWYWGVLH